MELHDYQKQLEAGFRNAGFESPDVESAYIVTEITGIPYLELLLNKKRTLAPEQLEKGNHFFRRRLAGEPYQYIFGWAAFRFLDLKVGPGVLIPRPETELLVDLAAEYLPEHAEVCELGTGSGAISLALASEHPSLKITGSEISEQAYEWSRKNKENQKAEHVTFLKGSLYEPFGNRKFDAVVANLPYIAAFERELLPSNVREHEPAEALFAEDDGFALIEQAILQAPAFLKNRSALFFELGEEQGSRAVNTAVRTNFFQRIALRRDQYGRPRFLTAFRT